MMTSRTQSVAFAERLKRARYRAGHRGTLEMDQILAAFADAHLPTCDEGELARFESVMEEADTDLLAWITGQADIPHEADSELIGRIRDFQVHKAKS